MRSVGSGRGKGGGGWSGERIVILGINVMSGREDTGADGVSKYLSGSRDQVFGTVDRNGLLAKRRA